MNFFIGRNICDTGRLWAKRFDTISLDTVRPCSAGYVIMRLSVSLRVFTKTWYGNTRSCHTSLRSGMATAVLSVLTAQLICGLTRGVAIRRAVSR